MSESTSTRCVLLTGAAGFLGAQIARRLLREPKLSIVALVRAENPASAAQRLARAWWDWLELIEALTPGDGAARIEALAGDVSLPCLGLDEQVYARLAERITHIIHAAADLRVNAPIEELRKTNVQGTENLLELAGRVHRDHGLQRFAHISTAYVAGRRHGKIGEEDLSDRDGFSNAYEQSKYEGECLAQAAKSELPVSIFRPGMIVGDSKTGEIRTFNTIYYPLRLYLSGRFPLIPIDPALTVNIVPVDYVADAIVRLTLRPEAIGQTFHLTPSVDALPRADELVKLIHDWAEEHLGLRRARPIFIRLPISQKRYDPAQGSTDQSLFGIRSMGKLLGSELRPLLSLVAYFLDSKRFHRENADRLLGPYTLNWREFVPNLLEYASNQGFMHRTERTVHEQLLVRLASKSRPINYFDILDGKPIQRSGEDVRREILAAAGALTALGIKPGERVAIVGLNNTRYLALDTAIGLIGAVSVPLYYTSPMADIDHILTSSGARLLLVGAPKLLEQLGEIQTDLPVVSFCRQAAPASLSREVISWEKFLALGADIHLPAQAPVGFGDLATLRYSSGTTGLPKGVSFQHQQLRWMGQTMASLLPWKARIKTADYLSFLPMNHVVEGILATYCTYYAPVPVNVYMLEDIHQIQRILPKVRPTVFFSVPRIYERIWNVLEQNRVGQLYLRLERGPFKRVLGKLLRWRVMKKAGLDRCAQLLAGSAPCSEALLKNYREIGVEIHNAYGLTEAPLITLNHLGENRLGTVGTPLPQTEVRIAEDGEVLVRGPQVMSGYFVGETDARVEQPFRDGWLLTGDLGSITPDGNLILNGRKKELIKTSYGKYVQPLKVESLLREIPVVAEAMLVGEQRPYCTALLWAQVEELDIDAKQRIDSMIAQINRRLSHPEQVKRWAVLKNDLSVEGGSLTPNLKLKRMAIAQQHEDVLKSLYDGMRPNPCVLHMGEAPKD